MLPNKTKEQSIRAYLWTLLFLSLGAFLFTYQEMVDTYNTTILAFTYEYGFISRALIGTLYHLLDAILPVSLMSYEAALYVTLTVTLLLYALLFRFCAFCLKKCPEEYLTAMEYLLAVFMIFMITTFSSKRNLGRLDVYLVVLSICALWLLMKQKAQWLVIPLSALGVMVHQGYVFMYFNLILVLLLYLILRECGEQPEDKRRRRGYGILLAVSFLLASGLFLWFEFFSHVNGTEILEQIVEEATVLTRKGEFHETLIAHEILGIDLSEVEWPMHIENFVELPFFILFILPYLILAVCFFRDVLRRCATRQEKLRYWIIILGAATMLPCFILKVDYGRWFMAVITYYIVILVVMLALGDTVISETVLAWQLFMREKHTWAFLLMLYPILFLPFWDVHVDALLKQISNRINENFLHVW